MRRQLLSKEHSLCIFCAHRLSYMRPRISRRLLHSSGPLTKPPGAAVAAQKSYGHGEAQSSPGSSSPQLRNSNTGPGHSPFAIRTPTARSSAGSSPSIADSSLDDDFTEEELRIRNLMQQRHPVASPVVRDPPSDAKPSKNEGIKGERQSVRKHIGELSAASPKNRLYPTTRGEPLVVKSLPNRTVAKPTQRSLLEEAAVAKHMANPSPSVPKSSIQANFKREEQKRTKSVKGSNLEQPSVAKSLPASSPGVARSGIDENLTEEEFRMKDLIKRRQLEKPSVAKPVVENSPSVTNSSRYEQSKDDQRTTTKPLEKSQPQESQLRREPSVTHSPSVARKPAQSSTRSSPSIADSSIDDLTEEELRIRGMMKKKQLDEIARSSPSVADSSIDDDLTEEEIRIRDMMKKKHLDERARTLVGVHGGPGPESSRAGRYDPPLRTPEEQRRLDENEARREEARRRHEQFKEQEARRREAILKEEEGNGNGTPTFEIRRPGTRVEFFGRASPSTNSDSAAKITYSQAPKWEHLKKPQHESPAQPQPQNTQKVEEDEVSAFAKARAEREAQASSGVYVPITRRDISQPEKPKFSRGPFGSTTMTIRPGEWRDAAPQHDDRLRRILRNDAGSRSGAQGTVTGSVGERPTGYTNQEVGSHRDRSSNADTSREPSTSQHLSRRTTPSSGYAATTANDSNKDLRPSASENSPSGDEKPGPEVATNTLEGYDIPHPKTLKNTFDGYDTPDPRTSRSTMDGYDMPGPKTSKSTFDGYEIPDRKTSTSTFDGYEISERRRPEDSTASRSRYNTSRSYPGTETVPKGRDRDKAKRRQQFVSSYDEVEEDKEAAARAEEKRRRKAEKAAKKAAALTPIFLPEWISVSNLATALKTRLEPFIGKLEDLGYVDIHHDLVLGAEDAGLIAQEFGFEPIIDRGDSEDLKARPPAEDVSVLPPRPPVVTIMGHVDHGKTTLLDWLRKSSVVASEHGGITQHIGAFSVPMPSGKIITFLDTPGHEAFLSMRQRGANVTDIVVLVVAADDSVKPQTIEAINHAKSAKVPIIVAINKIDKPDANPERAKHDLARHGVEVEDIGGDTQAVCVSGLTGQGMEDLEETLVTLSEILDMRAETDGQAEGWVIEASLKSMGKVATVLVKRGTMRPGDFIVAGKTWARIRCMRNEAGVEIEEAGPGTPVEIDGWREQPLAGDEVLQAPDESIAKQAVEFRLEKEEQEKMAADMEAINEARKAEQEKREREKREAAIAAGELEVDELEEEVEAESSADKTKYINYIVKADVSGSAEAVVDALSAMGNDEVRPRILRSGVGQLTEFDVEHAAAAKGHLINFNTEVDPNISTRALRAGVKILDHNIIYKLVDDVREELSDQLPPIVSHSVTGEAEVSKIFEITVKGRKTKPVAGCKVRNGVIKRASKVKVMRQGEMIFDGTFATLKNVKKNVLEMHKGNECGIELQGWSDFQEGDLIQCYDEIVQKRYL